MTSRSQPNTPVDDPRIRDAAFALWPTWIVLPGRKVAHAMVGTARVGAYCGQSRGYPLGEVEVIGEGRHPRLCEMCVISLVSERWALEKFFVDHVSVETKRRRRKAYREWLKTSGEDARGEGAGAPRKGTAP